MFISYNYLNNSQQQKDEVEKTQRTCKGGLVGYDQKDSTKLTSRLNLRQYRLTVQSGFGPYCLFGFCGFFKADEKIAILSLFIELDKKNPNMFMKIQINALFRLEEYFLLYLTTAQKKHCVSTCIFKLHIQAHLFVKNPHTNHSEITHWLGQSGKTEEAHVQIHNSSH